MSTDRTKYARASIGEDRHFIGALNPHHAMDVQ